VNSANRTQNNLIWILRHLVLKEIGIAGTPPSSWFGTLLALPWLKPRAKSWMAQRYDHFGGPTSDMDPIQQSESIWNLIPCSLAAYFDDGIYQGLEPFADMVDRAVLATHWGTPFQGYHHQ
jgi:hypothetical protein